MFVQGFGFDEVDKAINKYFAAYKIQADVTEAPLEQFAHPIYLKLFCEAKNPERREWVDVQVGTLRKLSGKPSLSKMLGK